MRVRLLALVSAVALFSIGAVPAQASNEGHGYLALGDSVAFGFHPVTPTTPISDRLDARNFIGYPEIVAQRLNIEGVNASCSGEATGGFIDAHGLDNSCRGYRAHWPLHTAYIGTQLAFAVNYLKANPRTRLVTLNLDANDFFRLISPPSTDFWPPSTCYTPNYVTYFSSSGCAVQNLEAIFAAIRGTGYTGLIVAMTYYALDYSDLTGLFVSGLLNRAMVTAAAHSDNVLVASGFDAFKPFTAAFNGSSCNAGLLIRTSATGCDIHPTPAGRDLLAGAIVQTIADSCPANSAIGCLNRNQG
jgi:lysophospholipase L1-like esterase